MIGHSTLRLTYLFPCILSSAELNHCHVFLTTSKWPLALVRIRNAELFLEVACKILRSPAMATRMHRLFKPPLQRLMRGRRVESPEAAPQRQLGRHQHANHSGCNPASGSSRGVANLALQPRLGILSQQRFRPRRVGPRNSLAPRTHIVRMKAWTVRRCEADVEEAREPKGFESVGFFQFVC
jgi:hypothetical protein